MTSRSWRLAWWLVVAAALFGVTWAALAATVVYPPDGFEYAVRFLAKPHSDRVCLQPAQDDGQGSLVPADVDGSGKVDQADAAACLESPVTCADDASCADPASVNVLRFTLQAGDDQRFLLVAYRDWDGGAVASQPSADDGLAITVPGKPVLVP